MRAAVLGSGIIGLWTAYLLAKRGIGVRIISSSHPMQTTSAAAASVLTPFLPWDPDTALFRKHVKWAADTLTYLKKLPVFDEACRLIDCYECGSNDKLEDSFDVGKLRFLDFSSFERIELRPSLFGADFAIKYSCYMCAPYVFMPWLINQCENSGVVFEQRTLTRLDEVADLEEEVVFNCLGHHGLFPDPERYGVFGQSVFIPAENNDGLYFGVGLGDYAVFRQPRGYYLGSYFAHGIEEFSPRPEYVEKSLNFVREMLPGLCERLALPLPAIDLSCVHQVRPGVRPFRKSGPRLERQNLFGKIVVHHYGHGAHGWTLGYASARDAIDLVYQDVNEESVGVPPLQTLELAPSKNSIDSRISIRPAESTEEVERCAEMMFSTDPWRRLSYTRERCLRVLSQNKSNLYVSISDNNELLGFISAMPEGVGREPLIEYLCVEGEHRSKGIGTLLVKFFEQQLFPNARNMYLFVSDINPRAAELYQRLDYLPIGALENFTFPEQTEFLYRKTRGPRHQ
jgi:D-amino-acid oxidase